MVSDFNRFSMVLTFFVCSVVLFSTGCDEARVGETLTTIEHPEQEQSDLVEFLKTLTGESPPDYLLSRPVKLPDRTPLNVDDK